MTRSGPRLPFGPLLEASGAASRARREGMSVDAALAAKLGYTTRELQHVLCTSRLHREGLTLTMADRLSIRLGHHPANVWGDAWWDAVAVADTTGAEVAR